MGGARNRSRTKPATEQSTNPLDYDQWCREQDDDDSDDDDRA